MLFNPAVGFELLRTAAERGDAEAQAYLGFRLAMGIYPPLPGDTLYHGAAWTQLQEAISSPPWSGLALPCSLCWHLV